MSDEDVRARERAKVVDFLRKMAEDDRMTAGFHGFYALNKAADAIEDWPLADRIVEAVLAANKR